MCSELMNKLRGSALRAMRECWKERLEIDRKEVTLDGVGAKNGLISGPRWPAEMNESIHFMHSLGKKPSWPSMGQCSFYDCTKWVRLKISRISLPTMRKIKFPKEKLGPLERRNRWYLNWKKEKKKRLGRNKTERHSLQKWVRIF